jgi:hypothetical protein
MNASQGAARAESDTPKSHLSRRQAFALPNLAVKNDGRNKFPAPHIAGPWPLFRVRIFV